jgi:hypothetical protein
VPGLVQRASARREGTTEMTEEVAEGATEAGGEGAPPPSNVHRLRTHLKPGGLASTLLDAWVAGDARDADRRLREALESFHKPKQVIDEYTEASED